MSYEMYMLSVLGLGLIAYIMSIYSSLKKEKYWHETVRNLSHESEVGGGQAQQETPLDEPLSKALTLLVKRIGDE